ncbi:MAG: parB-like partition protein [Frankiales bacterium]|nr:parB-like partition protein [Frankiales bacterium]
MTAHADLKNKLEAEALRLLRDGATPQQVVDRIGIPHDRLRALAGQQPTARCDHLLELPVHLLRTHPANIRTDLGDPDELAQLQQSIHEHGVLEPILVLRLDGQYVVLAGHRRLHAAQQAGLHRVPVRIGNAEDTTHAVEKMLVENLQRASLTAIDEARAYQVLRDAGRSMNAIAASVGKNVGHISQRLALLNLTAAEQAAVARGEITISAGYKAGRDRSDRRRPHDTKRPKPKRVPHFTKNHPLADQARAACTHEVTLKLGVACGPCWEATIRTDQAVALLAAPADVGGEDHS